MNTDSHSFPPDRKATDEIMPSPEAYLAAIFDSSDDAIISKDLNGTIRSWNQGATRLFGYAESEIVGMPMTTIIPPERRNEEEMILARIRRGEKIANFQTVRLNKGGEAVDVSVSVSPIRDRSGDTIGASHIARNIADLVQADLLNEHLAAIIESSDDAIISKDLDGTIRSWNRGAERLYGYLAEEIIGKPILMLLPEDRMDEETTILDRIRRGERVDHFETVRVHKDGRTLQISVTISPIRDRTGRVVGASKVARDISERKQLERTTSSFTQELERQVRERTAELESANRELEAFTYSMAHDIRAPLRALVSTSRILMEDFGDGINAEARELLLRQVNSANYLSHLVNDLLTYARLGRIPLNITTVDLTALTREISQEVDQERHHVVVEEHLVLRADRALLRIVLQNLLDNACKFSAEGSEIVVGEANGTYFVRDQGQGFDMTFAEKIFLPFERLVRQETVAGTGIGLANVKRIIEKHGGSIWVSSVPGHGTTFYFSIPQ